MKNINTQNTQHKTQSVVQYTYFFLLFISAQRNCKVKQSYITVWYGHYASSTNR